MATILLIDDDQDDRDLFSFALAKIDKQIQFLEAGGYLEASMLLNYTEPLPDFIFLDLNMPRKNGKEAIVLIKNNQKLKHIPIIVYTTSRREESVHEMTELGAVLFITKPSREKDLEDIIKRVLEKEWETTGVGQHILV